jgi:putative flavoprotein involved in K+ transport
VDQSSDLQRGWGPGARPRVVESEPGLYFVGTYFLYALSSVLIGGVGRDAEHVARDIALRQPTGRPDLPMPAGA